MQKPFLKTLLSVVYPVRCAVCDRVMPVGQRGICRECRAEIEYPEGALCCRCGKPVEEEAEYCQDCSGKESSFLSGRAGFLYNGAMQGSVSRFKYQGRAEYAAFYAETIWNREQEWIRGLEADLLIPVPVHPMRYRRRGYNQAALIARSLSELTGIPTAEEFLLRIKNTLPQKELSDRERYLNLQQAFAVSDRGQELYPGTKCAIIIDDIYTTGSTMEACAQVLRSAGIDKVYFLCVCIGKGL